MPTTLITTATDMMNGADAAAGTGSNWTFTFAGTWAAGDTYTMTFINTLNADVRLLGAGTVTGLQPSFCFTYNDKINLLAGTGWYFSDVGAPTSFNDPMGLGNGFIELANYFGTPEDLTAISTYQGRLVITSRRTAQIWTVDPDIQNYQKGPLLQNIGTRATRSMQAVGDMDVYMLSDCGFRSIRVRDASNNAIVAGVGEPIDTLIQALLATLTDSQAEAACGVIEPTSNRYWCYIPAASGTAYIWVLSFFPMSGIAAWTRYIPKYNTLSAVAANGSPPAGTNTYTVVDGSTYYWAKHANETTLTCGTVTLTASGYFVASGTTVSVTTSGSAGTVSLVTTTTFVPTQFVVQNGRVYARAGDKLFLYGGTDNNTYDYCLPQYDMPFLNAKSPATRKTYHGLDHIAEGLWTVSIGTDITNADSVTTVLVYNGSSVMEGKALAAKQGTHFKIRGIEKSGNYARFSSAILHFDGADAK